MTTSLDTIRYHSGIAGEEVADMVDSLEQEVSTLREQVEKLTDECVVLRASSRSKLETISSLELQVEKLTKERDELVNAMDNEMVVTHMGVFNPGDDPKVALNKICCYAQDLGKFFAEDACKEQLLALAEQNAKMRAFVIKVSEQTPEKPDYWSSCGQCEHNSSNAEDLLELPDLATPVLNRIKAEAYREAADICSEKHSLSAAEEAIRNRKAELEKNNG